MMKGILKAMGHRVQWKRVSSSMHRVDSVGVLTRMARMGCVARRTYSVQGPLHLVHIDTNHKLIRYGLVIFGGIDGFSRKIMYLGAATDNKASTSLDFFLEGVQKYGFPLRIERLWRDVWMAVSNVHYEVLHSLEDEGVLDPSDSIHLFCAQHVFLPRLQRDLNGLG
ncbi:LL-diaminopimelate aminotransferase [Dissostichus eleginoides]|uniref:LL-diaminopimelate aminotransferase n=1 Tax=Dissostichus eleginoides TaxID=100907 RepID=A0AAD9CEU6_DISEL|nr:LL-diaminopimelate aminotransferase [Dissostichus eleginoides]